MERRMSQGKRWSRPDGVRAEYTGKTCPIVRCLEEIPCNVCESACLFGAIHVGPGITGCVTIEPGKCVGCGSCVAACPGLAIVLMTPSRCDDAVLLTFPYERLPVPEVGDLVEVVDGEGEHLGTAPVEKVLLSPVFNRTTLISTRVSKGDAERAQDILVSEHVLPTECPLDRRSEESAEFQAPVRIGARSRATHDRIVCRCEEVTEEEIRETIRKHRTTSVNEVKKLTRAGMGPCQGKICEDIVRRLIREELGWAEEVPLSVRPPIRPVAVTAYVGRGEGNTEEGGE